MNNHVLRILVTATMSAGKSTLINALIGKSVARTSQEVCTGNLCYIYNQSVENNKIIFYCKNHFNPDADAELLHSFSWSSPVSITCYFRNQHCRQKQICLIDTPGVNSAMNLTHGKMTQEAILNENYHILVHILNANKIGSDDEIRHLQWVLKNISGDRKIIFVLNKLDDFKLSEDSIPDSIDSIKRDLRQIGYQNPVICPVSAYFGFLLKKRIYGEVLGRSQQIDYDFLADKFRNPEFDLSVFYPNRKICADKNPDKILYHKCGMRMLEEMLFQ